MILIIIQSIIYIESYQGFLLIFIDNFIELIQLF